MHNGDRMGAARAAWILPAAAIGLAGCLVATTLLRRGGTTPQRDAAPDTGRATQNTSQAERPAKPYAQMLGEIDRERRELAEAYRQARMPSRRREVLQRARAAMVRAVAERIAPYWYGTPWAFHGTTQQPGAGSIACGYFVATVLRDAGFRLERVSLAQQPAERIILSLTGERHIRRFSDAPLGRFVRAVRDDGAGLYVVGLDYHVGLLLCEGAEVFFLHSSGLPPRKVVKEPAEHSAALANSRYRVYGKISADDALLRRWLLGEPIPTRRR